MNHHGQKSRDHKQNENYQYVIRSVKQRKIELIHRTLDSIMNRGKPPASERRSFNPWHGKRKRRSIEDVNETITDRLLMQTTFIPTTTATTTVTAITTNVNAFSTDNTIKEPNKSGENLFGTKNGGNVLLKALSNVNRGSKNTNDESTDIDDLNSYDQFITDTLNGTRNHTETLLDSLSEKFTADSSSIHQIEKIKQRLVALARHKQSLWPSGKANSTHFGTSKPEYGFQSFTNNKNLKADSNENRIQRRTNKIMKFPRFLSSVHIPAFGRNHLLPESRVLSARQLQTHKFNALSLHRLLYNAYTQNGKRLIH